MKVDQSSIPDSATKPSLETNDHNIMEFDGSENKIVVDSSLVHSPPLSANAPEVADMSSTLSVSGSCVRASISGKCLGWCLFILIFLHVTSCWSSLRSQLDEVESCQSANLCSCTSRSSYCSIIFLANNHNNVSFLNRQFQVEPKSISLPPSRTCTGT